MPPRPVAETTLPDRIFARLLGEIVSGRPPAGAALASERDMAAALGVNRHAVREALGRLEQIGLIRISQGGATRVRDFRLTAGLDLLGLVAERAEALEEVLPLLAHGLELRATIGADVARLAALRATPAQREEIARAADAIRAAPASELAVLDRRFWQLLLDCAGNLAYQLAFNSLIRAVDSIGEFHTEYLARELERAQHRRPIAAAVCAGEPEAAEAAARTALTLPAELTGLELFDRDAQSRPSSQRAVR
jgi:DNA-binding FadR family transcriptional regulator